MNILVTGSNGFIGKNLVCKLKEENIHHIIEIDIDNTDEDLENGIKNSDFIFHLAGVNRPKDEIEFSKGNTDFTEKIISITEKFNKNIPILITSSTQVNLENAYGKSKKEAEDKLIQYKNKNNAKIYIYRLSNVFGKWCKPNYNSAVATFCYNIANDKEVWISDSEKIIPLIYIDDLVKEFINQVNNKNIDNDIVYYEMANVHQKKLGEIVELLKSFKNINLTSTIPNLKDTFTKYLYSTYLSYLNEDKLLYCLDKKSDNRGYLAELIKSTTFGQIFISKTKPQITRGNHYHHTKVEKFMVIDGYAKINLRKVNESNTIEFLVKGEDLKVIDIPPGYTHSITNISDSKELITLFWANEIFDNKQSDTFYLEV